MQYENIILEMISRIKQLEARCDQMEDQILQFESACAENMVEINESTTQRMNKRQKMTLEMMEACYHCGVVLSQTESPDFGNEIDKLTVTVGMNRNSAIMYVYAVKSMLDGVVYKRAISKTATELFFQYILKDFGKERLKKAISATRSHIVYRRELGHVVDGLDDICNQYEQHLVNM